jgi:hypothetical protein
MTNRYFILEKQIISTMYKREMLLSILICTLPSRIVLFEALKSKLNNQAKQNNLQDHIEILSNSDESISVGNKRNLLLKESKGLYVCFIDDDDDVADYYIEELLKVVESNKDCASLKGIITWDGQRPEIFEHSIKYQSYKNDLKNQEVVYERYPNHLNCIKSNIAKQIAFTDKNFSEDTDYADMLFASGLIKTEFTIDKILYYYLYATKK